MDARLWRALAVVGALVSLGAGYRTPNFVISAATPELAEEIGRAAEQWRNDLAIEWLGAPMPQWSQPCPVRVEVSPHLGAGGATSFAFDRGEVFGWQMNIQGSRERVLDSVLPHEITHTILACHFRRPLPRWADEGICTTVEHSSEKSKHQKLLINFLRTERGIPFSAMFAMKEYPADILPIYAQGHSLASYLLAQGGKQKFLQFLADGMQRERWGDAVARHYGYQNLAVLQDQWLGWVRDGSPNLEQRGPSATQVAAADQRRAGGETIYRGQSPDDSVAQPLSPRNAANDALAGNWRPYRSGVDAAAVNEPAPLADTSLQHPSPVAMPIVPSNSAAAQATDPLSPRQKLLEWSRAGDPPAWTPSTGPSAELSPYAYTSDGTPSVYSSSRENVIRR